MTRFAKLDDFLTLLRGVKSTGNGRYMALCPGHDDKNQSLSVKAADSKILLKCFAGCTSEAIVQALGLEVKDLFLDNPESKTEVETIYDYVDDKGKPLFQVVRFKPKTFRLRQPDGKWNIKGLTPVLYHLDDVLTAVKREDLICIVEGEKDCDNLRDIGQVSTTNPMGAGKWRDSYSDILRGADIVIIPDNDEPGRQHASQVAASCDGKAKRIRILEIPSQFKDVSDWLSAGHTRDDLDALILAAIDYVPRVNQGMKSLSIMRTEIQGRGPTNDIINDLLPDSPTAYALLCGRAGIGKTFLGIQLIYSLASGKPFLNHKVTQCAVGYISMEGADTKILERFNIIGKSYPGAEGNIFWHHGLPITLRDKGIEQFKALIRNCQVVVVDPLRPLVPGDYTTPKDASTFLRVLQEIQVATGTKLILCHHIRKPDRKVKVHPEDLIYEIKGASEYVEAANTVLLLERADQPRGAFGHFMPGTNRKLLHFVKVKDAPSGAKPMELQFNAETMLFEPILEDNYSEQ